MTPLTHHQKIILVATTIPLITLIALGIPFTKMGFDSDCFGLVWLSKQIVSWQDLLTYLTAPIQHVYLPPNELANYQENCLSYFRPFMVLSHYLAYSFFGLNPYAYHLINVTLHGFTASGLFYLFAQSIPLGTSFFLALIFIFHPALTPAYVGVTSHVVPTYLFLILSAICYYHACLKESWWWQLSAALFLLGSLLCYEIAIIFPLVALLYHICTDEQLAFHHRLRKAWSTTWLLWLTIFGYIFARLLLLGVNASGTGKQNILRALMLKIMSNWHQSIKPFWGMKQYGKLLPALVTLIFILGVLSAFYQRKKRRGLLYWYPLSFVLCAWPIPLVTSDGRYFYPAIPFFCLMVYEILCLASNKLLNKVTYIFDRHSGVNIVNDRVHPPTYKTTTRAAFAGCLSKPWRRLTREGFDNQQEKELDSIASLQNDDPCNSQSSFVNDSKRENLITIPLIIITFWFAITSWEALATREQILHRRDNAFHHLVAQYKYQQQPQFIFLGTMHYFAGDTLIMQQGMTQALQLFFNNQEINAYHITEAKLYSPTSTPVPYIITPTQDNATIGFRFTFPEPKKLCIMIPHAWQENKLISHSMGKLIVHHKTASWKADDITFFIDQQWLTTSSILISFDYSSKKFKIRDIT